MQLTAAERHARQAAAARDADLDASRRRREGIVHTPPELARFVARAADDLVRERLGLAGGLADPRLALVDPACGPGAFLAAAQAVSAGGGPGPRVCYAIDRDRASLRVTRAGLGPLLQWAHVRLRMEAKDTLESVRPERVARLAPAVCVIGNPPWVASAQQRPTPWLDSLLEDFRRDDDGARLPERKLGVLSDAYVRFMRWACEVARGARSGAVVALVTNASYLDGPVHRGMRAALLRFFDSIFVLDLGGNALLPRSGAVRDGNVFGVRPGVAALLAVRSKSCDEREAATVRYQRVFGSCAEKLERLSNARLSDRGFRALVPDPTYRRFVPTSTARDQYARWPSLAELMPFHREGVQTNRDGVVVDANRERLHARLRAFAAGDLSAELAPAFRALPHYDPALARVAVADALERDPDGRLGLLSRPLAYRPSDRRWFAPIAPLCHRPRPELLAAIDRSSFALVTVRKDRGSLPWAHFAAVDCAVDNCFLSTRSSCRARAFPTHDSHGRENLAPELAARFSERLGRVVTSTELARYALALLARKDYRERYDQALRIDYPRIPWPESAARFDELCAAGADLVELFCNGGGEDARQRTRRESLTGLARGLKPGDRASHAPYAAARRGRRASGRRRSPSSPSLA
ncbi:MAG: type ISP restriction/modification enzyme [Polyangiales bacterium]